MKHQVDQQVLKELVERNGLRFRSGPQSWIFTCPKCLKKDKLYIRKRDGRFKCMRCAEENGFYGWADFALSVLLGRSEIELNKLLYGGKAPAGTSTEFLLQFEDHWGEFGYEEDELEEPQELPEVVWAPDIVDLDDRRAKRGLAYLEARGVSLSLAKEYGVRYSPPEERVVFPVVVDGKLRGWQGRYIGETEFFNTDTYVWYKIPKILTVGAIGGKALMFNDRLKGSPHAVMVEGPIDAIKSHLCGGNVATMGKGVSRHQLELIVANGVKKLYIGLDPDAAQDIMRVIREMSGQTDLELFRLEPPPGAEDLGASTQEAVLEQFQKAQPIWPGQLFIYFDSCSS